MTKSNNSKNGMDALAYLRSAHSADMAETGALLDRVATAEGNDQVALLQQAMQKLERVSTRLIDAFIQSGGKIRPVSLAQKKRVDLGMLLTMTDSEKRRALSVAEALKDGAERLPLKPGESSRFLRDVANMRDALDALEKDKGHRELPYTRLQILMAYFEAFQEAWQRNTLPTLAEVGKNCKCSTEAIRQFLNELGLPWRKERTGRRKGSKDRPDCDRQQRKKSQRKK
jgi:hypothetical protein